MNALLQIAEPGEPGAERPRLAGVDLGTTHSLIAVPGPGGQPRVLDVDGGPLLPSAVSYGADGVRVGRAALDSAAEPGRALFTSVKRALGLRAGELAGVKLPFAVIGEAADPALLTAAGDLADLPQQVRDGLPPEQICAEILRVLAERAEHELGGPLDQIVLTVPAYFSESQRQAAVRAAALADLRVLRLVSEPTAAALAYGLDNAAGGTVVVYDLGGGTFDCSVLVLKDGVFEVRATAGDTALGGDNLDFALAAEALEARGQRWDDLDRVEKTRLLHEARSCKEALSTAEAASLSFAGRQHRFEVADLERLAEPLLRRTLAFCRRALRDAELELDEVDELVLVGGATRMPVLRQRVGDFFGRKPHIALDPDQVVVCGAALQANALCDGHSDSLLVDVTPLSLGIETLGGMTEIILPRNSPIPAVKVKEFTTARDGQTALSLHVVQGERPLAEECRSLARFSLTGIPPMAAGTARIRILFRMDENGLLRVSAREQSTGVEAQVQTARASAFAEGEIRRMLQSAEQSASEDQQQRRKRETLTAAEMLLDSLKSALEADSDLLDADELNDLQAAMTGLEQACAGGETAAIRRALAQLSEPSDAFAQKRMDAAVRSALVGAKLDEVRPA